MAQGWARSLEKILAELVGLFQVVKSRTRADCLRCWGFGVGIPGEGREVGAFS